MTRPPAPVHAVQFLLGAARWEGLPATDLPEVAFIGRSNVGKSSLLNMLLGRRELARTSGTPGKTQQFNYYLVDERFHLVDLPGYGYARIARTERERWGRLIGRYLVERAPLRGVFHLIDGRHPPQEQDRDIMALMKGNPVPYVVLLTKADKLSGNERQKSLVATRRVLEGGGLEVPVILTSSTDARGREAVWEWIDQFVG